MVQGSSTFDWEGVIEGERWCPYLAPAFPLLYYKCTFLYKVFLIDKEYILLPFTRVQKDLQK